MATLKTTILSVWSNSDACLNLTSVKACAYLSTEYMWGVWCMVYDVYIVHCKWVTAAIMLLPLM